MDRQVEVGAPISRDSASRPPRLQDPSPELTERSEHHLTSQRFGESLHRQRRVPLRSIVDLGGIGWGMEGHIPARIVLVFFCSCPHA